MNLSGQIFLSSDLREDQSIFSCIFVWKVLKIALVTEIPHPPEQCVSLFQKSLTP